MGIFLQNFFVRFKLHFLFWFLFLTLFISLNLSSSGKFTTSDLVRSTLEVIITSTLLVYINLYFFLPRFFYTGRYLLYSIILLIYIPFYTLLLCLVEIGLLKFYGDVSDVTLIRHIFISNLVFSLLFVVITTALKLSRKWFVSREEMQRLRLEKLEAELQFLRTQMNPHFLFNTLNNLYSLILTGENEKAGDMVLKLSGIMDYMLHDSKSDRVELITEINQLQNYLDLERIRFSDTDRISFTCESDNPSYQIAPSILLPFIENGFKYGISNTIHNGFIRVDIKAKNGALDFTVENSKPPEITHNRNNGIGLSNIKRRLEILYPNYHSLKITDGPLNYHVHLKLLLNEYSLPRS